MERSRELSLPLSAHRYGNVAEEVAVVKCSNDATLYLIRYSCEGNIRWHVDTNVKHNKSAVFLFDLAAKRINRATHLRALLGATIENPTISGERLYRSQRIIMFCGQREALPSEGSPLAVDYRIWFDRREFGTSIFRIDSRDLPFVTSVTTVPWSQVTEAV